MKDLRVLCIVIVSAVYFTSCTTDEVTMDSPPLCETEVSYDADIQAILGSNCAGCHTADGNLSPLTTFDEVKAQLEGVRERAVVSKDMPPSGPLPDVDITKINCWIEQNAPKN